MPNKRTLIVTGQKPITTVKMKSGGNGTLYEVYATDTEGEVIEEPLRTFAELEEGVAIEYLIDRYDHPQYGTSYTLTPPKRNTQKRLRETEEQLERLVAWANTKGFDEWEKDYKLERASEVKEEEKKPEPIPAPDDPALDDAFGADPPEGFGE